MVKCSMILWESHILLNTLKVKYRKRNVEYINCWYAFSLLLICRPLLNCVEQVCKDYKKKQNKKRHLIYRTLFLERKFTGVISFSFFLFQCRDHITKYGCNLAYSRDSFFDLQRVGFIIDTFLENECRAYEPIRVPYLIKMAESKVTTRAFISLQLIANLRELSLCYRRRGSDSK